MDFIYPCVKNTHSCLQRFFTSPMNYYCHLINKTVLQRFQYKLLQRFSKNKTKTKLPHISHTCSSQNLSCLFSSVNKVDFWNSSRKVIISYYVLILVLLCCKSVSSHTCSWTNKRCFLICNDMYMFCVELQCTYIIPL